MPEYFLRESHVTYTDINHLITIYNKILIEEEEPVLTISAEKKLLELDTVFIGYLILFKARIDKLDIQINLPHNNYEDGAKRFYYKAVQYGTYAYLLTGTGVFKLNFKNKLVDFLLKEKKKFDPSWFVLSENFMLLLFVSERKSILYKYLFEEKLSHLTNELNDKISSTISWSKDDDKLYGSLSKSLLGNANPSDRQQCVVNLGLLAFYKTVFNAKILSFFTIPADKFDNVTSTMNIFASDLGLEQSLKHFKSVKPLFEELYSMPLIYQFVFSTLTSSELLPNKIIEETAEEFTNRLASLWHFTKDIVHGIKELSKNILEHTKTKMGIVSSQIIHKKRLDNAEIDFCYKSLLKEFRESKPNEHNDFDNYLNIQVFDLGENGIIPTLIESSKKLINKFKDNPVVRQLIDEDILALENKTVKLFDLLSWEKSRQLNQQCKRSIAHFGLLTFSKLITINKGFLLICTNGEGGTRDNAVIPYLKNTESVNLKYGTSFNILLPVSPKIHYYTHLPHSVLTIPNDLSANKIRGIEELFSFKHINAPADWKNSDEDKKKYIITFAIPAFEINNRDDEEALWKVIQASLAKIPAYLYRGENLLYNLDFSKQSINASQLLRLLGNWETEFPRLCLIVSNIEISVYKELLDINIALTKDNDSLGFWNDTMGVIVYSYLRKEKDKSFYFTDIFWGKTLDHFVAKNKSLHRNHFNSITLLNELKAEKKIDTAEVFQNSFFSQCPAFFNRNVLLPFDLILKGENGFSFFENNAMILLQSEINEEITS